MSRSERHSGTARSNNLQLQTAYQEEMEMTLGLLNQNSRHFYIVVAMLVCKLLVEITAKIIQML